MRKMFTCVLALAVGLALLQLAGCKKSEPTTGKPGQPGAKSEQPGPKGKTDQPGAKVKTEQPGAAASDPLAAASKKLVGVSTATAQLHA